MQLGLIGLGVMGRNLALNFAEKGVSVVAWDPSADARAACAPPVAVAASLADAIAKLDRPRRILLCVPAGAAVEALGVDLAPLLQAGDRIIDGGNSHYRDTIARAQKFRRNGFEWIGLGVSGGEDGARHGAAFMVGASAPLLQEMAALLAPVAARAHGLPCLALIEGDGAGHFVKMAHNGIEYALMQVLAELYIALRHGLALSDAAVHAHFADWAAGRLSSYLADITVDVLKEKDPDDGRPILESIRDRTEQKGTGAWAAAAGMELAVAVPTIAAAVGARAVSCAPRADKGRPDVAANAPMTDAKTIARVWGDAAECAFAASFAQGFDLIVAGAKAFGWTLDAAGLARSWRGGCIVRADMLDAVSETLTATADNPVLLAPPLRALAAAGLPGLREAVRTLAAMELPAPALASALAYVEALGGAPLGANLVAAQRHRFGRHGVDRKP